MKVNEAPKKIYVVDATFPDYVDFDGSPINTKRIDSHDIEYMRTDAFIDNAKKWFNNKNGIIITDTKAFFEEFIDYVGM